MAGIEQSQEEAQNDSPTGFSGSRALLNPGFSSSPHNCETTNFCSSEALSLWYFALAAWGNSYPYQGSLGVKQGNLCFENSTLPGGDSPMSKVRDH